MMWILATTMFCVIPPLAVSGGCSAHAAAAAFSAPTPSAVASDWSSSSTPSTPPSSAKSTFLSSLDNPVAFNAATKDRTSLLNDVLVPSNPTPRPGSVSSFDPVAPGTWRIIYAPHISTLSGIAGGRFDPVLYEMSDTRGDPDGGDGDGSRRRTIVSHARYDFPLLGKGWLSVSGTYGSEDGDRTCRVDFDRAWIVASKDDEDGPARSYEDAPDEWYKPTIDALGRAGFRREFSVFPVSYLDGDTIVFNFELFGTRICARKID